MAGKAWGEGEEGVCNGEGRRVGRLFGGVMEGLRVEMEMEEGVCLESW